MHSPWQTDILVSDEYTSFATKQTTGGEVWGAARSLQAYLESHPFELDGCRTVLELGSGTGWLGMTVARNAPAIERIYLTDMLEGGAFAWLQHNVALNTALSLRAVEAMPCDWAWFGASGDAKPAAAAAAAAAAAQQQQQQQQQQAAAAAAAADDDDDDVARARSVLQSTSFDLAIGSDLVYEEGGMRALAHAFVQP